jgi:hypothetical protein
MRPARAVSSVVILLTVLGCEARYAPRPLPETFAVRRLDGQRLDPAAMRGRPWLVNLWLPG